MPKAKKSKTVPRKKPPIKQQRLNYNSARSTATDDDVVATRNEASSTGPDDAPSAAAAAAFAATTTTNDTKKMTAATTSTTTTTASPTNKRKATSSSAAMITPSKRRPTTMSWVTPDDKPSSERQESINYVPTHIHKNLDYHRAHTTELSHITRQVYELVQHYYVIPPDLEQNRQYGPLSGTCWEEKVIRAYSLGLLRPAPHHHDGRTTSSSTSSSPDICVACASVGHVRDECPTLV